MFWSAGCSLLRTEGFSCSLGVLYGGLGISKLQVLIKNMYIKISSCKFCSLFGHQTLDPELDPDPHPQSEKKTGSGSAINQGGSKPCVLRLLYIRYNHSSSTSTSAPKTVRLYNECLYFHPPHSGQIGPLLWTQPETERLYYAVPSAQRVLNRGRG